MMFGRKKDVSRLRAGGLIPESTFHVTENLMSSSTTFHPASFHEGRKYIIAHPGNQHDVPQCAGEMLQQVLLAYDWKRRERMSPSSKYDPSKMYAKAKTLDGMPRVEGTTFDGIVKAAKSLGMMPEHWELRYFNDWRGYQLALHRSYTEVCMLGFDITKGYQQASRKTGMIKTGGSWDEAIGGHAVVGCGYDESGTSFNQTAWGDFGWRGLGFVRVPRDWFDKHLMYGASLYDPERGLYI